MQDYQGNSKKDREKASVPEKNVEKVITGEVIVPKKSIGRKVKDLFIEADLKSVVRYVAGDVLIPAARNMLFDAGSKGLERMMFGEAATRRNIGPGMGSRFSYRNYQSPVSREYRDPLSRHATLPSRTERRTRDEFIISTRDEASLILERMNDIIDTYEVASLGDLNSLIGLPSSHVDEKWGWVFLGDVPIRQVREGYMLDLPPAEPIQ